MFYLFVFVVVVVVVVVFQSEYKEVNILMFKQLAIPIPTTLHVCECGLVASLTDRLRVFDSQIMLREMYHISDIREVSLWLSQSCSELFGLVLNKFVFVTALFFKCRLICKFPSQTCS